VFLLFDKNLILAFDLKYSGLQRDPQSSNKNPNQMSVEELVQFDRPIFSATFNDADDTVSRIFFID
jgi:hypothetical protein